MNLDWLNIYCQLWPLTSDHVRVFLLFLLLLTELHNATKIIPSSSAISKCKLTLNCCNSVLIHLILIWVQSSNSRSPSWNDWGKMPELRNNMIIFDIDIRISEHIIIQNSSVRLGIGKSFSRKKKDNFLLLSSWFSADNDMQVLLKNH